MEVTLIVPDEVAAQARQRGMSVEAYIQSLIEQVRPRASRTSMPRTRDQLQNFFAAISAGSENLPALPTEGFTRESFYEDGR